MIRRWLRKWLGINDIVDRVFNISTANREQRKSIEHIEETLQTVIDEYNTNVDLDDVFTDEYNSNIDEYENDLEFILECLAAQQEMIWELKCLKK